VDPKTLWTRFRSSPLCEGLTDPEAEGLFALCEQRHVVASNRLFAEGAPADSLWLVLIGDVEISRAGKVLAEVGPGSVLGELSLFRAAPLRSATVTALCDCDLLRLPTAQFQKRLKQGDLAALKMVSNLAHQMADRLAAVNDQLISGGRHGLTVARTHLRRVVG